jgi:hypothetical protein
MRGLSRLEVLPAQTIHEGKNRALANAMAARAKLLDNTRTLDANLPPPLEFDARSGANRGLPKLGGDSAQRLLEGAGRLAA